MPSINRLKFYIFNFLSLLFVIYMIFYFSPLNFFIKIGNVINDKLFLDENNYIHFPKNWLVSISTINTTKFIFINKNFILDNNIDILDISIKFENNNNKGRVTFPNKVLLKKDLDKNYSEYNGKNCKYRIYGINNKIYHIYIPKKNAILNFSKYDSSIPIFIDEFCKD